MKITRRELRKIIKEETQQHKLKAIIKESVQHQDRMILEEGIFQDAMGFIKEKGKKAANATKDFLIKFKTEMSETKEGAKILAAIATGKEISKEDFQFIKDQASDIAKGSAMLGLFVLPGGGIAATALVKVAKKFGIDLMPSAFSAEKEPSGA